MSIWGVRCLTQKFIRQAYILANRRLLGPVPQRSPPAYAPLRPAHSSLYQMVKKRTLEARTKLQANKYPNHQVCVAKPATSPPPEEYEAVAEASSMPTYANAQFQAPSQSEPLFKVVSIAHHNHPSF